MCGRAYSTYTADELYFVYLNRKLQRGESPFEKPNYNFSPTQTAPIIRLTNGSRAVDTMTWGLIPEWSPEFKMKFSTINARSEGVFESRLYKKPILTRRCIIPVSGFFEWKKEGSAKRPFKIFLKDQPIMSLAGIWTSWRAGTPDEQRSFSIMTTAANSFMEKIHDRMPVILDAKQFDEWLDPEVQEQEAIAAMLKPCPAELMECAEISTLVNKPANNRAEVLEPLSASS
jgi:putative SOS response-associated peptidase YedK